MKKLKLSVIRNLSFYIFLVLIFLLGMPVWAEAALETIDVSLDGKSLAEYLETKLLRLDGKWELYLEKTPEQVFRLVDNNYPSDYDYSGEIYCHAFSFEEYDYDNDGDPSLYDNYLRQIVYVF